MLEPMLLPEGVRDFGTGDAALLTSLRTQFLDEFALWGYSEVVVPTLEFSDAMRRGETYNTELLYRLFDRKGRVLVLRPDVTESVARMASEQHEPQLPVRYCYFGNAFRQRKEGSGLPHELWQAGFELIGVPRAVADAEVVSLGLAALARAGVINVTACIGYPALAAGLPVRTRVAPAPLEEVPALVDKWFSWSDPVHIAYLKELAHILASSGAGTSCVFDISLVRELTYYSGPVFEFYAPGASGPLAGGGRYDSMCARFGRDLPATGLAIDVLKVMDLLGRSTAALPARNAVLIGYEPGSGPDAVLLAADYRSRGIAAEIQPLATSPAELHASAVAKGRPREVWVTGAGSVEIGVPESGTGQE
jgi:ATP phosphoribosyltransferase regulatory subunit